MASPTPHDELESVFSSDRAEQTKTISVLADIVMQVTKNMAFYRRNIARECVKSSAIGRTNDETQKKRNASACGWQLLRLRMQCP